MFVSILLQNGVYVRDVEVGVKPLVIIFKFFNRYIRLLTVCQKVRDMTLIQNLSRSNFGQDTDYNDRLPFS